MCTLAAKKIVNRFFIFKTRDLDFRTRTRVIRENKGVKKLLIVDERGHCEGLNEYGIGIIEATLKPFPLVKYPDSSKIARRVLSQKNILAAIEIIKNSRSSVNNIISDGDQAFIIEKTQTAFAITKIKEQGVIANLSLKLSQKNGPHTPSSREIIKARYLRAKKIIDQVKSLAGIKKFLSDKKGYPHQSICRGPEAISPTRCAFIYDLKNCTIFFCPTSPDQGKFKKYQL